MKTMRNLRIDVSRDDSPTTEQARAPALTPHTKLATPRVGAFQLPV
jgi:hypothetical protein